MISLKNAVGWDMNLGIELWFSEEMKMEAKVGSYFNSS